MVNMLTRSTHKDNNINHPQVGFSRQVRKPSNHETKASTTCKHTQKDKQFQSPQVSFS